MRPVPIDDGQPGVPDQDDTDDAFDAFFARHYDQQVRRAFLLTGSSATAHDLVAEVFTRLYDRWDTIDEPRPYLYRSVVNACRDAARSRQRRGDHAPLDDNHGHRPLTAVQDQRRRVASFDFSTVELADALAALPHRQRAAIVLRYYGRESEAEIAAALDCRPGTVGSLIHRGLAQLRKDLS